MRNGEFAVHERDIFAGYQPWSSKDFNSHLFHQGNPFYEGTGCVLLPTLKLIPQSIPESTTGARFRSGHKTLALNVIIKIHILNTPLRARGPAHRLGSTESLAKYRGLVGPATAIPFIYNWKQLFRYLSGSMFCSFTLFMFSF